MSEERATASAVARQIARQREDAKAKAELQDKLYKLAVSRQLQYFKDLEGFAVQMLISMQRTIVVGKKHNEEKLRAMKYRLEAEITRDKL